MPAADRDNPLAEAQRAVDASPQSAAAWHRLGLARQNLAMHGEAAQALAKAASLDRDSARYQHDLGNALAEDGKLDRAITAYRRALRIDEAAAEVHNDLGTAYFEKQWFKEAEACFQRAVELKPDHGVAHANLGAALRAQGRLQDGRRAYQRALLLKLRGWLPSFLRWKLAAPAGAEIAAARAALNRGDAGEALQAATRALRLEPASVDGHCLLSGALRPSRPDLAEQAARRAVELDARSHAAHGNLGASLWALGRHEEAERHAREALRLAPDEPNNALNVAIILKDTGKLDEARAIYRARRNAAPEHPLSLLNMGTLAVECEADLEAARAWFAKGLALRADPHLELSAAVVDLLDGRFDTAWEKYEARKRVPSHLARHAPFAAYRPWEGEALTSGRLLVYGEQGLGDEVMFASMYAQLAPLAPQLTLLCDDRLEKLFRRSFPAAEVVPWKLGTPPNVSAAPERVAACGSLGRFFRRSAADFPAHRGYLVPDPAKAAEWRARLASLGPGRKVGFSWIGGTPGTGRARRSLKLDQIRPLLETPGTTWVSLQYGEGAKELAPFKEKTGLALHEFPGVAQDMDDLASLVQALDLVVSVCNTTVHVAGAIGKEVLVLAPFVPEWRYGIRGERMLWYPSARVFRQKTFGDWDSVIAAVKAQLGG